MTKPLIPVLSLFCGAGGMDYGFALAGFKTVLAIDQAAPAVDTFNTNFSGEVARAGDLATLSPDKIIDWLAEANATPVGVIGGPPCQGFSVGNTRAKADDPRNNLPFKYCDVLERLNARAKIRFFVFENVLGLRSPKHRSRLTEIVKRFDAIGFYVFQNEVNAIDFRVPQNRRRLFLVGINKAMHPNVTFEWPTGHKETRTVDSVLRGLPTPVFRVHGLEMSQIPYHPNHWTSKPHSTKFTNKEFGDGRSFRQLKWNAPSWTVAYGNREIHIHPSGKRRLTVLEAMLLQSFPKKFVLKGNFSEQVTQVSNAVPPRVARAVATAIRTQLFSST